jgi:NADH-quinone oxidoreductase subunit C
MHDKIIEHINKNVPGANAILNKAEVGDSSITVNADHILKVCESLKNCDEHQFNVLQVITATDYLAGDDSEARIELSYILASFIKNIEVIIKVSLPRGEGENLPEIDSVCSVWKAANFLEREAYDMIGVKFKNHPDHRRILCPQDWEGYPLRRDYVAQKSYRGMEVYPEDKLNLVDQGFGAKSESDSVSNKKPMKSGRYS